jgi:hypothetical protein
VSNIALTYPTSIIPKSFYKRIINFDALYKRNYFIVIVRRSDKSVEETFYEDFDTLKGGLFTKSQVSGFSMNLLGQEYKIPYLKFRQKGKAIELWNGEVSIDIMEFENDIDEIKSDFCPIFYKFKELHNLSIPYGRTKDKSFDKVIKSFGIAREIHNNKYQLNAFTKINHQPNMLNYWHVEFDFYDGVNGILGDKITATGSKWQQDIANDILDHVITGCAFREINEKIIPLLPVNSYHKFDLSPNVLITWIKCQLEYIGWNFYNFFKPKDYKY